MVLEEHILQLISCLHGSTNRIREIGSKGSHPMIFCLLISQGTLDKSSVLLPLLLLRVITKERHMVFVQPVADEKNVPTLTIAASDDTKARVARYPVV